MKGSHCDSCYTYINVLDSFDEQKQKAFCSATCRGNELMFCFFFSDKEYEMRKHYAELTGAINPGGMMYRERTRKE